MPKLDLSDLFIETIITQVAPLVSRATGWPLELDSLHSRLLPKDRGYEEILLGRVNQVGLTDWQEVMPDFLERMIEYMLEENTLAAYMPGAGEILVIRENVDDSNLDGLKLILAHELVHRAQHIAHGGLFTRVDNLLKQAFMQIRSETTDFLRMRSYFEQIQPVMTLLESHAAYVQGVLARAYFPNAHIETHFNLARLFMRVVGAPKVSQYTEGLPLVSAAITAGNLEWLYNDLKG